MTATSSPAPAHIAMFSIAAHGHVNPSLELIRELVRRGHRVTYAIPPRFADKIAETGAEPVLWESTLPTDEDGPEAWGTELIDHIEPFLADAIQALPQLVEAYDRDRPDLILYDITAYPARILAHRYGVPIVQLSPNLVAWEGYETEVAAPLFDPLKKTERGAAFYRTFEEWIRENGMDLSVDRFMGRPDRCLVLIPSALQPHADRVDEQVYSFVGTCSGARQEADWQRPEGAEKVLLVSLGSSFTKEPGFYRDCIAAFADLPAWHVVLGIGKHVDPAELGEIPDHFEVRSWLPQLRILEQADVFVTHAGAGGSQEGLLTATPMVAVPQAVDQFQNAAVLEGLGVARHLPKEEVTPEKLREAVLALAADLEVADRLAAVRAQTLAEGGTQRAADLVEAELA